MRKDAYPAHRTVRFYSTQQACYAGLYRQWGLSLTELMVTLSVLSVLSLGVADFSRFVVNSRVDTGVEHLRTALALARTESIKRGLVVVICRRAAAQPICAGTSAEDDLHWQHGWLLYADLNQNKRYEPGQGDRLLRQGPAIETGVRLLWNKGDYIAYQPSGALSSRSGRFCVVADEYDPLQPDRALLRELIIPYSGRVRLGSGGCNHEQLNNG